jgi:hypothetical protein
MKLFTLALVLAGTGCSLYFADPPGDRPTGPFAPPEPPISDAGSPADGSSDMIPARCETPEVDVFGVYETRSDHTAGDHPVGEGGVTIERPGVHKLVLSAYEPTHWQVTLAPGASVASIHLIGYHAQTINTLNLPAGVPITIETYDGGGTPGCGYSYPYNGQGCDTNQLLARVEAEVGSVNTFHGCYHASQWALRANDTAKSDCDTAAGYRQDELIRPCTGGTGGWERATFTTNDPALCTGARYVRHDDRYGLWVGAIQCGDANHYKLYMSDARDRSFLQIADYAGDGQDHCELVNPAFTIPDEDDITSGGCTACSVGNLIDVIDVPVYARARFGEPFQRVTSVFWADLTTTMYACGVAIP